MSFLVREVCPGTKLSSKEQVIKMTKILAGMGSSKGAGMERDDPAVEAEQG